MDVHPQNRFIFIKPEVFRAKVLNKILKQKSRENFILLLVWKLAKNLGIYSLVPIVVPLEHEEHTDPLLKRRLQRLVIIKVLHQPEKQIESVSFIELFINRLVSSQDVHQLT